MPHTILRAGILFGTDDHFTRPLAMIAASVPLVFLLPGEGENLLHPLWVEDLATVIGWTLEDRPPSNAPIEIGGPEFHTLRQVMSLLLPAAGLTRIVLPTRQPYLRAGAALMRRILPRPPISPFFLDYLASNRMAGIELAAARVRSSAGAARSAPRPPARQELGMGAAGATSGGAEGGVMGHGKLDLRLLEDAEAWRRAAKLADQLLSSTGPEWPADEALGVGAFEGDVLLGAARAVLSADDAAPPRVPGERWNISHLALDPSASVPGLDEHLMLVQREQALSLGLKLMTWVQDPLDVRLARLAVRRLGGVSRWLRPTAMAPPACWRLNGGSNRRA